jgi:hypothetical protein
MSVIERGGHETEHRERTEDPTSSFDPFADEPVGSEEPVGPGGGWPTVE